MKANKHKMASSSTVSNLNSLFKEVYGDSLASLLAERDEMILREQPKAKFNREFNETINEILGEEC